MEQSVQVWHTQVGPQDATGEPQKKVSVVGQPECSICCYSYDNVFKTPKVLECTHTFCLECLSRLMVVSQDDGDRTRLICPFCRHLTTLTEEGPPALATSRDVLCKLPHHQQEVEPVYLDGEKLCYQSSRNNSDSGTPDSPTALCICIDIGTSKTVDPPNQTQRQSYRLADWKRMVLFFFLMLLLIAIVLWPLKCVFNNRHMPCMRNTPAPTPTATITTNTIFN